ncbi:hypothetical protein BESB_044780 [Besnoitia besnoiti]|uniref:Uncharacterized protein n=1 Tax=Besnoitia besnoiti TaxID=94643 RepID=A0A2A9MJZ1_BESBE|nr:hypothetical protein BESB_044780 [Besnoitia besnoiti]PFH36286.1 hypothetical protein BESB_044780 [Besnoitia besnoiti]
MSSLPVILWPVGVILQQQFRVLCDASPPGRPLQWRKSYCLWAATALIIFLASLLATAQKQSEASNEGGETPDEASSKRPAKKWEATPLTLPIITFRGTGPARPVTIYGYQGLPTGTSPHPQPRKGRPSEAPVVPPPKRADDEEATPVEAVVPPGSLEAKPPSPPTEHPPAGAGDEVTPHVDAEPTPAPEAEEEPPHEGSTTPEAELKPSHPDEDHTPQLEEGVEPPSSEEHPPMVEAQVDPGPAKVGPPRPPTAEENPPLVEGAGAARLASARERQQSGHNEALHRTLTVVDQIKSGADCVALVTGTKFLEVSNYFPHQVNKAREAAFLSGVTRLFFQNLEALLVEIEEKKAPAKHTGNAVAKARSMLKAEFQIGDRVKEIDKANNIHSRPCVVKAVHGKLVSCGNGTDETRELHTESIIKSEDSATAAVADLCLKGEWSKLEKTDPVLYREMTATLKTRGWDRAFAEAKQSKNWTILLRHMEESDSTGLLALADASRMIFNVPVVDLELTAKPKKDASLQNNAFSISELLSTIERMQVLLKTGALPGCAELSILNALGSGFVLWAHVVGHGRRVADMKANARTILETDDAGSSCLAALHLAFGRKPTGRCAGLRKDTVSNPPRTVANKPGKEVAEFLSQICTTDGHPKGGYPTGYVTKCDRKCLTRALTWDAGASRTSLKQQDHVNGDVLRAVLAYEKNTLVLLDQLAWTLVGFSRSLLDSEEHSSSFQETIEMDICAAGWFKRRPHGHDSFGFGLLNVELVASFFVTHFRVSLLAAEADLMKGRQRRKRDKTSPAVATLFRGLTCGGDGSPTVTSKFPLAAYVGQIAFFFRVSMEESTKVKYGDVIRAMGGESFNEKKYDRASSWMQAKAAEYVQRFMPGYDYKGHKILQEKQKIFFIMHKLASLLSILWLLGITEPGPATSGSSARLLFVFLLYSHGRRPDEYYIEKIRSACGKLKVTPRRGFLLLEGNPKRRTTVKDILKPMATAVKYAFSDTGDLQYLDTTTNSLVEACRQVKDEELDYPARQQLVIEYQCMILQKSAVSFLSKLFGSKLKKPPAEEAVRKAFEFLEGIHEVHTKDDSNRLLQEYKKSEDARKPWNSEGFPTVDCRWKHDKSRQQQMITTATGYAAAREYEVPEKIREEICAAHPLPPLSKTEISYPLATDVDVMSATMGTLV